MQVLNDSKILFIGPTYFGYEKDIIKKLNEFGAKVDYIPENIDYINPIFSVINKLPSKLSSKFFEKYFLRLINRGKNDNYDFILLIRGKLISSGVLKYLKSEYPKAKFIMYQWDSIKNVDNVKNLFEYFDKIYTFDLSDYQDYSLVDNRWNFRPLFYVDDYKVNKKNYKDCDIDLLFVGSYHSDRNLFLKKVNQYCKKNSLNFVDYLFIPKIYYFKRKITSNEFRNIKLKDIKFKSLSRKDLLELIKKSKVIIDFQANNQTGLTIRTIESIGSKRKIITTNEEIKKYDFYNSENIMVIDKNFEDSQLDIDFLSKEYVEIEKNIYEKYSLNNWVLDIFIK